VNAPGAGAGVGADGFEFEMHYFTLRESGAPDLENHRGRAVGGGNVPIYRCSPLQLCLSRLTGQRAP